MGLFGQSLFGSVPFGGIITPPTTSRAIPKAGLIPYLRRYLNDPNGNIWDDTFITTLINEGEVDIFDVINLVWIRFSIPILTGVGTYQINNTIKAITRMTYRGFKVDMLTQKELALLSPVYRTQQTRPRWATLQFEGYSTLRLYPVPTENLPIITGDSWIYTDSQILNSFVVSAYVYVNESNTNLSLPDYYGRRIIKLFVLWKAYSAEGLGQNLQIASYYKKRYLAQRQKIIQANTLVYANKERTLSDIAIQRPWRKARPILPPNFGTPVSL